jgi:glycosyl transferase, family 25
MQLDVPCLVINMLRAHERRAHMVAELGRLGIRYEFFEAIDGDSLDDRQIRRIAGAGFSQALGLRMSKALIACTLSHYGALRTMVDRGIPLGIIFEDDAQCLDDFTERVREALAAPADWDMLKLNGAMRPGMWGKVLAQTSRGKIVQLPVPTTLATAYAVTNAGARKLLPFLLPVPDAFDLLLQQVWVTGLDIAELIPYPVRSVGLPSSIEKPGDPRSFHRTLRRIPHRLRRSVGRRLYLIQRFGWPPRADYKFCAGDDRVGPFAQPRATARKS